MVFAYVGFSPSGWHRSDFGALGPEADLLYLPSGKDLSAVGEGKSAGKGSRGEIEIRSQDNEYLMFTYLYLFRGN